MILVIGDIDPLYTHITPAAGIIFIAFYLDNPVVLYFYFETAILGTKNTTGLFPSTHVVFSL